MSYQSPIKRGSIILIGYSCTLFIEVNSFFILISTLAGLPRETDESADLKTPAAQF